MQFAYELSWSWGMTATIGMGVLILFLVFMFLLDLYVSLGRVYLGIQYEIETW